LLETISGKGHEVCNTRALNDHCTFDTLIVYFTSSDCQYCTTRLGGGNLS